MSSFSSQYEDQKPRFNGEIKTEEEFFEEYEGVEHQTQVDLIDCEDIEIKEESFELESDPEEIPTLCADNLKISSEDPLVMIQNNLSRREDCQYTKEDCQYAIYNITASPGQSRRSNRLASKPSSVKSYRELYEELDTNQPAIGTLNLKSEFHKCKMCRESFSIKKQLEEHNLSVHKICKPFKCLKCDKRYCHKEGLSLHIKFVHDKVKRLKRFKCVDCDYVCSTKQHLSYHINSVHEKISLEKKLLIRRKCPICNLTYTQLTEHIKAVHEKFKPLKCIQCDYSCRKKYDLDRHVKAVHEKPRPYVCLECGLTFSRKGHLLSHMPVHDEMENKSFKSYKCTDCNYTSYYKSHLSAHLSAHKIA